MQQAIPYYHQFYYKPKFKFVIVEVITPVKACVVYVNQHHFVTAQHITVLC